jgi:hypothetical protein
MDLYGYERGAIDDTALLALREATIVPRSVEELRRIAAFLLDAAQCIDEDEAFGHQHWRDWAPEWERGTADLIVQRPEPDGALPE